MHTTFYASGFLYDSSSQKILLQQLNSTSDGKPFLFGSKAHKGNDPQTVFKLCVEKALARTIKASSIHPVYDYMHDTLGEQFIFFVEISGISPATYPSNEKTGWFALSKLSKMNMSEDTRHDILIGERVIRSRDHNTPVPVAGLTS